MVGPGVGVGKITPLTAWSFEIFSNHELGGLLIFISFFLFFHPFFS